MHACPSRDTVERSRVLLEGCQKVVYFLNGASTCETQPVVAPRAGATTAAPNTESTASTESTESTTSTHTTGSTVNAGNAAATDSGTVAAALCTDDALSMKRRRVDSDQKGHDVTSNADDAGRPTVDGIHVGSEGGGGGAVVGATDAVDEVDDSALVLLVERLDFLHKLLPTNVEVMVNITKASSAPAPAASTRGADLSIWWRKVQQVATRLELPAGALDWHGDEQRTCTPADLITDFVLNLTKFRGWRPGFVNEVHSIEHLDHEGSLDPEAICTTLARMFKKNMLYDKLDSRGFVMRHIIRCFKEPLLRVDQDDTFKIWLDRDTFQAYLEQTEVAEVPDVMMYVNYEL